MIVLFLDEVNLKRPPAIIMAWEVFWGSWKNGVLIILTENYDDELPVNPWSSAVKPYESRSRQWNLHPSQPLLVLRAAPDPRLSTH